MTSLSEQLAPLVKTMTPKAKLRAFAQALVKDLEISTRTLRQDMTEWFETTRPSTIADQGIGMVIREEWSVAENSDFPFAYALARYYESKVAKKLPQDPCERLRLACGGYNGAPRESGRTMMSEVRGSQEYAGGNHRPAEDIVFQLAIDAVLAAMVDCVRDMYKTGAKALQNA